MTSSHIFEILYIYQLYMLKVSEITRLQLISNKQTRIQKDSSLVCTDNIVSPYPSLANQSTTSQLSQLGKRITLKNLACDIFLACWESELL